MTGLLRVWIVVGSLALTTVGNADEVPDKTTEPAASGEQTAGYASVLVKIKDDKTALSQLMERMVSPQMQEIKESFIKKIRNADEALADFRKNPTSRDLASRYEDSLSQGTTHIRNFISEFAKGDKETLQAFEKALKSGEDALVVFRREVAENEREAKEFEEQADDFDQRLAKLAQDLAKFVKSDKSLPVELDTEIQKLKISQVLAQQNAKSLRKCASEGRNGIAQYEAHLRSLAKTQGKLKVAFHQAHGQVALLSNVARNRHNALLRRQLMDEIAGATTQLEEQLQDLDTLDKAFEKIVKDLDTGIVGPPTPTTTTEDGTQVGAEILKEYLSQPKTADATAATGAQTETNSKSGKAKR